MAGKKPTSEGMFPGMIVLLLFYKGGREKRALGFLVRKSRPGGAFC